MDARLRVSQLEQEFIVVEYKRASNDVSAEADEPPLLEAVIRKQLVEGVTY
jgi:hypothetical protein